MLQGTQRSLEKNANTWLKGFFTGQDVFIIGGGKSAENLPRTTINKLKKQSVIALNRKVEWFENPAILMMLDDGLGESLGKPGNWPYGETFKVLAGPQSKMPVADNVYRFGQCHDMISRNPAYLLCDVLGLAAVNAAVIGGAKRVFLVGIDCGYGLLDKSGPAPTMKDPVFKSVRRYMRAIPLFEKFAKFDIVYRVTEQTHLKRFPYMDLEVALASNGKKN